MHAVALFVLMWLLCCFRMPILFIYLFIFLCVTCLGFPEDILVLVGTADTSRRRQCTLPSNLMQYSGTASVFHGTLHVTLSSQ